VFAIGAFVELGKGFYYQQLLGWLSLGAILNNNQYWDKEKGLSSHYSFGGCPRDELC